jgi:hypothetical protein
MLRYVQCSLICGAFVISQPAQASRVSYEQSPMGAGTLRITLESSKAVYILGERITLRLTVHNETGLHIGVMGAPPYGLCRLFVLNAQGQRMPSTGEWGYRTGLVAWEFSPGQVQVARFSDPESKWSIQEWADIKYWGYKLNKPGAYTIFSVPTIEAFARANNGMIGHQTIPESNKSNEVHIQVQR